MSIILKNIHNKEFQRDVLNKSKTSNFINISEDHSDNSKIKFKDNNHSDINPIKNKIRTKLLYSKFKLEKIPKFKKIKQEIVEISLKSANICRMFQIV